MSRRIIKQDERKGLTMGGGLVRIGGRGRVHLMGDFFFFIKDRKEKKREQVRRISWRRAFATERIASAKGLCGGGIGLLAEGEQGSCRGREKWKKLSSEGQTEGGAFVACGLR